ncbi:MAG: hypothetical protein ACYC35_20950 [Pirellulales bacterium]
MLKNHARRTRLLVGRLLVLVAVAAAPLTAAFAADLPAGEKPSQVEPTFDGRTLEEWKRISLADLSGEAREKSMDALGRFGRARRRDEAVAAIKAALEQCGPQAQAAVPALLGLVREPPETNARSLASDQELAICALAQIDPFALDWQLRHR